MPPPPYYTHVSRSREARRVSVIRGTHLQMPHLHHLRRDGPLGIQRTNCYARNDHVASQQTVGRRMNPYKGRVVFLKLRVLLLKGVSIKISGNSRVLHLWNSKAFIIIITVISNI